MITISTTFLYSLYAMITILALPYCFLLVGIFKMKKRANSIKNSMIADIKPDINGSDFMQFINEISHEKKNHSSQKN